MFWNRIPNNKDFWNSIPYFAVLLLSEFSPSQAPTSAKDGIKEK
jgi:hypothetical protein